MRLDGDTGLTVFLCVLVMTIGGCLYGVKRDDGLTEREKEKTKQIEIQAKIDSLKIVSNTKEGL